MNLLSLSFSRSTVLLIVGLLFGTSFGAQAQETSWRTLGKLTWKYLYDEDLGFDVSQPVFGAEVKALDGKEIDIVGYIIPVDLDGDFQVLSAFPYSNCFFCGGAGPETVMELEMSKNYKFISEKVQLRGILRLNADDFQRLIYRLERVEVVREF